MKHTYEHTFRDGVKAEMHLDVSPQTDQVAVYVAWTPEFDPAFLDSVMEEYLQWSRASIADYGKRIGRGFRCLTI